VTEWTGWAEYGKVVGHISSTDRQIRLRSLEPYLLKVEAILAEDRETRCIR
jgi:hypothetical protein